ncbi:MAG: hypothetical protein HY000_06100 [Planctomycetes bacterium]|nr:hypothetical protein [Planctomycetota bacterium]
MVEWWKLGLSDAKIIERIEGVTQADLDTAWDYYEHNRDEIEQTIRENQEA